MALIAAHLDIIRLIQEQMLHSPDLSVLSLGYPDALISDDVLRGFLSAEQYAQLVPAQDGESVLAWHGLAGKLERLIDTQSLFEAMHLKPHYIDIVASRGIEEVVDLNHPMPEHLHGKFDMVLDLGTVEHCFNIGQCMMNVAQALRVGGVVLHSNPIGFYNHGFFNFTPSFYSDFYGQNGFTLHYMKGLVGTPLKYEMFDLGTQWNATPLPAKSIVLVVAQRTEMKTPGWPVQSKYRANPALKG